MAASMAPVAPRGCAVYALVPLTGMRFACSPNTCLIAAVSVLSFNCVELAVGVDVIDLLRRERGVLQRVLHRADGGFATRQWRRHMKRVVVETVTEHFRVNARAADFARAQVPRLLARPRLRRSRTRRALDRKAGRPAPDRRSIGSSS